jgi:hypothetical protein
LVLLTVWGCLAAPAVAAEPVEDDLAEQDDTSGTIVRGVVAGSILTGLGVGVWLVALGPQGRAGLEGRDVALTGLSERPVAGLALGGAILAGGIVGGTVAGVGVGDGVTGALAGLAGGLAVAAPVGVLTVTVSGTLDTVAADMNTLLVVATSGSMAVGAAGGVGAVFAAATACGFGHCATVDQITTGKRPRDDTDDDNRARQRAAALGSLSASIGCIAGTMMGCSPILSALEGGDYLAAVVGPIVGSTVFSFAGAALTGEPGVGLATAAGAAVGSGASAVIVVGGVSLLTRGVQAVGISAAFLALPLTGTVGSLVVALPTVGAHAAACAIGACPADPVDTED